MKMSGAAARTGNLYEKINKKQVYICKIMDILNRGDKNRRVENRYIMDYMHECSKEVQETL